MNISVAGYDEVWWSSRPPPSRWTQMVETHRVLKIEKIVPRLYRNHGSILVSPDIGLIFGVFSAYLCVLEKILTYMQRGGAKL